MTSRKLIRNITFNKQNIYNLYLVQFAWQYDVTYMITSKLGYIIKIF